MYIPQCAKLGLPSASTPVIISKIMRGERANNGWAGLGLINSNIHRDSYPLFLINVAFNRQRGWIKEVEGRLGCYKLYIQLYMWLKGKMVYAQVYQLCA